VRRTKDNREPHKKTIAARQRQPVETDEKTVPKKTLHDSNYESAPDPTKTDPQTTPVILNGKVIRARNLSPIPALRRRRRFARDCVRAGLFDAAHIPDFKTNLRDLCNYS
jgi:hypothetical protein